VTIVKRCPDAFRPLVHARHPEAADGSSCAMPRPSSAIDSRTPIDRTLLL
jgi:hypothetical protein